MNVPVLYRNLIADVQFGTDVVIVCATYCLVIQRPVYFLSHTKSIRN